MLAKKCHHHQVTLCLKPRLPHLPCHRPWKRPLLWPTAATLGCTRPSRSGVAACATLSLTRGLRHSLRRLACGGAPGLCRRMSALTCTLGRSHAMISSTGHNLMKTNIGILIISATLLCRHRNLHQSGVVFLQRPNHCLHLQCYNSK